MSSFRFTKRHHDFPFSNIFLLAKRQQTLLNPLANASGKFFPPNFRSHFPGKTHLVHTNNSTTAEPNPSGHVSLRSANSDLSDVIASNKIITSYIRAGDLASALAVFRGMKFRTTVTWNTILSGHSKMPGKIEEARQLFDEIPEPDVVSYNTMLACYLNNFDLETAQAFFGRMPVRDAASWNTMITGFSQNGMMAEACGLFSAMPMKNIVSWNAMISGYVESGNLDMAAELFEEAPVKSVVAWTAMITGFMKFGKIEMAEKFFKDMPIKNLVTWNAMIAGYVENNQAEDGVKLFKTMLKAGTRPNPSSLSSVLLGCSNLSALALGRQVHQFTCKFPLHSDTTVGTSLLSMYCKCGDLKDAWKLFSNMSSKDVVTWNAMISGYAQHGAGDKALDLFNEMKNERVAPDWITMVAVLLACNHAGLVDTGIHYFYKMKNDYGIEAKPDHYTCMVDLLGRAGMLDKALDLIRKMPFRPHTAIFGTLLGACRIHKNLELAEFAAKNLLDLDPASTAGYVQLANAYAAVNRWDHVARVRRSMKNSQVVKLPGCSWIEVRSVVHEFRSGDRIHPDLASIHEKLHELEARMKLAGYVPDLESALHNVGEEQKEQLLLWHSEKLAMAFGLMKLPLGATIRVFKNLRVCGDCHLATKFISAIEEREIILRDTTRFHHFKSGMCSCGDYW